MWTKLDSKWGLDEKALEREEKIERLHEAIAYHQSKIDEYLWKIEHFKGSFESDEESQITDSKAVNGAKTRSGYRAFERGDGSLFHLAGGLGAEPSI